MRFGGREAARIFVVLGAGTCAFLIFVTVGQGVGPASLWAGVLGALTAILAAVAGIWSQAAWFRAKEVIIYDSDKSSQQGHDFDEVGGQAYADGAHYGRPATAEVTYRGVISIRRTNNNGKYHLILSRYNYGDGGDKQILPANDSISGKRQLRVSCEARVKDLPHILWFTWRNESSRSHISRKRVPVTHKSWTPIDLYFKIDPSKECYLRIDDYYETGRTPSEVQIRRIVVAERNS